MTKMTATQPVRRKKAWTLPKSCRYAVGAMLASDRPFLLFDDARSSAVATPARLFREPIAIIRADNPDDLSAAFAAIDAARARGEYVAGYLSYELGLALEPRLLPLLPPDRPTPLLWFGRFADCERIAPEQIPAMLPDPAGALIGPLVPDGNSAAYADAFARVQSAIVAGDIYQANLTFGASARAAGSPLSLYAALRARAQAGYGGVIHDGENWFLSCSPELFLTIADGRITARPMKGTAPRGNSPAQDQSLIDQLRDDPKQRAENLMIVDLLRNDLSRIALPGSVAVPELFHVESYPTLHTMTSTITAGIAADWQVADLLRALFPCGSITGAPKIRAMELIAAIERRARGIYCGSMGWIAPSGDAAFNVAIRTMHWRRGENSVSLGLGSGIVADSRVDAEWRECLLKGEFADMEPAAAHRFDLIETMGFDPASGVARLEAHLERMKRSAGALGFAFDRHGARNAIQAATFHRETPAKVRLLLGRSGALAIELAPLPPVAPAPLRCRIVTRRCPADDLRLTHKTSDRRVYAADVPPGVWPVFVDTAGRVSESSIFSVFVERGGKLLTPPLARGVLPGVLRSELLAEGRAVEAELRAEDLADGFWLGNALRGLVSARLDHCE